MARMLTTKLPDVDRSLIVHLGMPKTGSTAIQQYLASDESTLSRDGVHYVGKGRHGETHHLIAWSLSGQNQQLVKAAGLDGPSLRLELIREVSRVQARHVVISSEAFFSQPRTLGFFEHLANDLGRQPIFLVFIRRQADQVESWYRQIVKHTDYSTPFELHIQGRRGRDYSEYFDVLEECLSSPVVVQGYGSSKPASSNAVRGLLSKLGLSSVPEVGLTSSNPSLDHELTELKRVLNPRLEQGHPQLGASMAEWSAARATPWVSLFTEQQWHDFQARFNESNARLAKRVGADLGLSDAAPKRFGGVVELSHARRVELLAEFGTREPRWKGLIRTIAGSKQRAMPAKSPISSEYRTVPHKPLEPDEALVFIHIPKTAGTSIQASIEHSFTPDETCPLQLWPDLVRAQTADLERWRLYAGHFFYVWGLIPHRIRAFTVLRNPVERAVSQFRHIARDPGHHLYTLVAELEFSLDAFLDHPIGRSHLDNHQSRHIIRAGIPSGEGLLQQFDTFRLGEHELLEIASAIIADKFEVVGIADEMDNTLSALRRSFSLANLEISSLNRANNANSIEVTEKARNIIESITEVDMELYQRAKSSIDDLGSGRDVRVR